MQAIKAKRTIRVLSALTDHLAVVRVTEGKKRDEYTVSSSDGAFFWTHRENPKARAYRVECSPHAGPYECDCPSRVVCRHILGSRALLADGTLAMPDDLDYRETVEDVDALVEAMEDYYERNPEEPYAHYSGRY